jgi:hypothetical protein
VDINFIAETRQAIDLAGAVDIDFKYDSTAWD